MLATSTRGNYQYSMQKKGHKAANTLPYRKGSGYEGTVCNDCEGACIKLGKRISSGHSSRGRQDVINKEKVPSRRKYAVSSGS